MVVRCPAAPGAGLGRVHLVVLDGCSTGQLEAGSSSVEALLGQVLLPGPPFIFCPFRIFLPFFVFFCCSTLRGSSSCPAWISLVFVTFAFSLLAS